jgi:NADPH2:quinone reductase
MKAVICKQYGPPETLVVEDVPSPVPGTNQAVVTVKAAGVNFPDTLIIQNKYQYKPPLPFSPGAEMAGIVKAVGGGVANVKPGDAVCGLGLWGAFAEEVLIDASALFVVPKDMPFDVAGSFALTYCTSYHGLVERGELKRGETLLVLGAAGGVGLSAVELGKAMGARVIAAASNDEKLAVCRQHGADEAINYSTESLRDRIKSLTGGKGVDVIYDPVGGSLSELALRDMAWRGRYLVVGFAAAEIPKIPLNLPLLKGCSIVGVFWGRLLEEDPSARNRTMQRLFDLYAAKKINPRVSAHYPLERASDALNAVLLRKVTGKVVLEP